MRLTSLNLVLEYQAGKTTLSTVRSYLEDVDWDDETISPPERSFLLEAEAYVNGISEGLNDEAELRALIVRTLPLPREGSAAAAGE